MALAIRFDELIREGVVADQAELARLGHVSRARLTQVMNLLNLAPDIQEEVPLKQRVQAGRDLMTERDLRPIAAVIDWNNQRRMWACRKAAALVKLRYFAGMSLREAADALGIARSTAVLHWTYAKSYLYCELEDGSEN